MMIRLLLDDCLDSPWYHRSRNCREGVGPSPVLEYCEKETNAMNGLDHLDDVMVTRYSFLLK